MNEMELLYNLNGWDFNVFICLVCKAWRQVISTPFELVLVLSKGS